MTQNPFVDGESAHQYVNLLREQVVEVRAEIGDDLSSFGVGNSARRVACLRLVDYKLKTLQDNLKVCSWLLNDLRSLRRLLLAEREANYDSPASTDTSGISRACEAPAEQLVA